MKPKYIALVGAPGSGKSTVKSILYRKYGVQQVDMTFPLRFIATMLGAVPAPEPMFADKDALAYKRGSKKPVVDRHGRHLTWREVMGEAGKGLESVFGSNVLTEMAVDCIMPSERHKTHCFDSCRMTAPTFLKSIGGVVVEIRRPGFEVVHDFDRWDVESVDHIVDNDGSVEQLQDKVVKLFSYILPVAAFDVVC